MKKIILLVCVNLMFANIVLSQFEESLTNIQFNKVINTFKGRRSDFGSYYFNNFPCTTCSGGYFFIKDNNSFNALYSYKGIEFIGVLKNPILNYHHESKTLKVLSNWYNTGTNGGFKSANISFEFYLGMNENKDSYDFKSWNTILRFMSLNSEMVAYYNLDKSQLDAIYSFLINDTKCKEFITEYDNKENKLKEDLLLIKKNEQKILFDNYKRETEQKVKYDSLQKINIRLKYVASIIGNSITIDNLVIAQNDFPEIMNWEDAKKACKSLGNGWRLPSKDELKIMYKNFNKIGGFEFRYYWSSNESSNDDARVTYFNDGFFAGQTTSPKRFQYKVRAVKNL